MFALDKAQQLVGDVFFLRNLVADIGSVKAADKVLRRLKPQALDDVGARQRIGGGRERNARHAAVSLVQHRKGAVFGPKVMAPLAHAVGFINRKQRQLALSMQIIKQTQKARRVQALGCGVQQGDVAALQAQLHLLGFVIAERGVQIGGADTGLMQRAHLIVHQRNQR